MICQILDRLAGDAGTTALQFAMVGIGCVLAYNSAARWWKTLRRNRPIPVSRRKIRRANIAAPLELPGTSCQCELAAAPSLRPNTIRPALVCNTLVTATRTGRLTYSRPPSTTTIVPSSR